MENWTKYIMPKYKDKKIGDNDCIRMVVAREQASLETVDKDSIILYCKEYLRSIGMKDNVKEVNLNENPIKRGFYTNLKNEYKLADKRDIIWLKFTKDGYLEVVATSNDINFSSKISSGKIVENLNKEWNTSYVVIFPLKFDRVAYLDRQRIESGIGNYLISKGVPILDYYSHNF